MRTILDGLRCSKDGDMKEVLNMNLTLPFDGLLCPRQTDGMLIPPWQRCRCWSNSLGAQVFCCIRHAE
jgi:hypothetical protein